MSVAKPKVHLSSCLDNYLTRIVRLSRLPQVCSLVCDGQNVRSAVTTVSEPEAAAPVPPVEPDALMTWTALLRNRDCGGSPAARSTPS